MKEKIKRRKKEITLMIIICVIILLFFSGFSMGKELSRTNINTTAQISKPILEVENGQAIEIKTTNDKGIYEFKVKNYNDVGEITQVDLEYEIEILSDINENISFRLYQEEEEMELENKKTKKILMTKEKKQEHQYRIEIEYNKESTTIQEVIQEIQIKVHSEQKKS